MLLNWRIWAALAVGLALAASHLKAYRMGGEGVRAQWAEAALQAKEQAREREQQWQTRLNEELKNAAAREQKIRRDADGARTALRGMHDAADAAMRRAADSHQACLVTADTATKLLEQCASQYRDMAEIADRHASDAQALSAAWPQ